MELLLWIPVVFLLLVAGAAGAFALALYLLPCAAAVYTANAILAHVLKAGLRGAAEAGGFWTNALAAVVTWPMIVWLWGVDGELLVLSGGTDSPLNPAWIQTWTEPGGGWAPHIVRDAFWALRDAAVWPLTLWHRAPLQHLGPLWKPDTILAITGIWLRYDAAVLLPVIALSVAWVGLARAEAAGGRAVRRLWPGRRAQRPAKTNVVAFRRRTPADRSTPKEGESS